MKKGKFVMFSIITVLFNLCFLLKTNYADVLPSDVLLSEGKNAIMSEFDYRKADAKFAQIMSNPEDPNYQKACFWRSMTVIAGNLELNSTFRKFNLLTEGPDNTEKLNILDKEGKLKYNRYGFETTIIDDKEKGYSESGTGWDTLVSEYDSYYGNTCRINTSADTTTSVSWKPAIEMAGNYEVFIWNSPQFRFVGGLVCEIHHAEGVSQFSLPISNEKGWLRLGEYKFNPNDEARITLYQNDTGRIIVADAVKLDFKGAYISESAPEARYEGNWTTVTAPQTTGGSYMEIAAGSKGRCVWAPYIPKTGKYQIIAYSFTPWDWYQWFIAGKYAKNISYIVTPAGEEPVSVDVGLGYWPGYSKKNLGIFLLNEGNNNSIEILQSDSGVVTTDGIMIIPIAPTPDSAEMQSDLVSMLKDADTALGYLDRISEDFTDKEDFGAVDSLGNPMLTEIDFGDILMFKSMINLFKAQANMMASYETDSIIPYELSISSENLPTWNSILKSLPQLGNIKNDASQRMSNAKAALILSLNNYLLASDFIMREVDPQDDDFIHFSSSKNKNSDIIRYFNDRLREIKDNLNGVSAAYIVRSEDTAIEPNFPLAVNGEYYRIPVNLNKFFDCPEDIRNFMPKYTDKGDIIPSSVVDPTFNGIFPTMTQEELNGILLPGPKIGTFNISWKNDSPRIDLEWGKDARDNFLRYALYRSASDEVTEDSQKVYDSADKAITSFTDKNIDSRQNVYYYRLYTYYTDGTKIASVIFRITTRIYVDGTGIISDLKENGTKDNPFKEISVAVKAASKGTKICVARGTYRENDRTLRFYSSEKQGIVLEGGYDPKTWKKDVKNNPTVITAPDSAGPIATNILGLYWGSNNVTVDGFTISGGQANGVYICAAGAKITNCTITGNKQNGIYLSSPGNVLIENCKINFNNDSGIYSAGGDGSQIRFCEISNNKNGILAGGKNLKINSNLITNNSFANISCESGCNLEIINNTIAHSQAGIVLKGSYMQNDQSFIKNNIIVLNSTGISLDKSFSKTLIDYNDVWRNASMDYENCSKGPHDISADPLFVNGPSGNYYLSQISSGQKSNSPCVDSGSAAAAELLLDKFTTATNGKGDSGNADLGCHFVSDIAAKGNPPAVGTVEPDDITVETNSRVNFATTYYDEDGWQNIKHIHFSINKNKSWTDCFVGYYNPQTNKLYLLNDNCSVWLGGVTPGSNTIIENSYVKLNCKKTKVSREGNEVKVIWSVVFKKNFTGAKSTYLFVRDLQENTDGFTQKGKCFIIKKSK